MCGLTGLIDVSHSGFLSKDKDLLQGLLYINSLRGNSSTGLFGVNKQRQADVLKVLGHPYNLFDYGVSYEFLSRMVDKYWAVFGHGRFPTMGETVIKNAHPFIHGHITLMHNGTLKNLAALNTKYNKSFEVDSELICWMVNSMGIQDTIKQIEGAYALIFYDDRTDSINILRNHERPLWMGINSFNDRATFGSEKHYLKWADEKGPMIKEFKEVPPNRWLKITREKNKLVVDDVECSKYQGYSGKTYTNEYGYRGSNLYEDDYYPARAALPHTNMSPTKPPAIPGPVASISNTPKLTIHKTTVCEGEDVKFRVRVIKAVKLVGEEPYSLVEGLHADTDFIDIYAESTITADVLKSIVDKANDEVYMIGKVQAINMMHGQSQISARITVSNARLFDEPKEENTTVIPQGSASTKLRTGEHLSKERFQFFAGSGCYLCGNSIPWVDSYKCSLVKSQKSSEEFLICGECHGQENKEATHATTSNQASVH